MPDQGLTTDQLDKLALKHPTLAPAVLPGVAKAGGQALSGAMDLLNRPNEAALARIQGRPFWKTLVHGEPQAQYQADTEATTRSMMGGSPQEFSNLSPVRKAANEFATQVLTDPMTYLGGTGLLRHAAEEGGLRVLPKVVQSAAKLGQKMGPGAMRDAFNLATEAAGWVHDVMTPGGKSVAHAIRELAQKQGAEGMKNAERMMSAASGSRSVAAHLGSVGKQLLDQALHGVPAEAQSAIFKAIHTGSINKLPEALRPVADGVVRADRSILWLLGSKSVRNWLGERGFSLPHELAPFDKGPLGLVTKKNIRENHVPMPHELDEDERNAAFASLNSKPGARALTDTRNKFFKERTNEPPAGWENDPDAIRETWNASFRSAGKALGGAELRKNLINTFSTPVDEGSKWLTSLGKAMRSGDYATKPLKIDDLQRMLGEGPISLKRSAAAARPAASTTFRRQVPSYVRKAFAAKAPTELNVPQKVLREFEKLGNLGKASLFTTPFGHQRNISTLLALANPTTFPAAMADYAKLGLGFAKPSKRMEVLDSAIHGGAVGPNIEQRDLTELLRRFGPLGKAASHWYGGVGKMLWGWDDAVKNALFKSELKHYDGDALRAAASVRRKMVDYTSPTQFQETMRLFMPFATWRTSMPQAVIRSIMEHPEYALGLNRATGGAAAGLPFNIGGKQYQSTNPLSTTNELTAGNVKQYLRGSMSLTSKTAADLIAHALGMKEMPFAAPAIEQNIPLYGQVGNPYGDTEDDRALYMLTGIHPYNAPRWHRYRRPYHHHEAQL